MNNQNRPRWTKSNTPELYILYFDILNSSSGIEYLQMLHEETFYNNLYHDIYNAYPSVDISNLSVMDDTNKVSRCLSNRDK